MDQNLIPVRWVDDVRPADWWARGLDDSYDLVSAIMPGGFEAHARLIHPPDAREPGSMPLALARILIELLRAETTAAGPCWFCVADRGYGMDTQGVSARVRLPSGGTRYLLYTDPLDRAIAARPARHIGAGITMRPDLTVEEIAKRLAEESGGAAMYFFHEDDSPADIIASLAEQPACLPEEAASIWWPEDRAWFAVTGAHLTTTFLGGSRRLMDRLRIDGRLEIRPATLADPLTEAEAEADERRYGPVIATGTDEAGKPWKLRGRIGDDGVWSGIDGGGSGGGALPFQDLGWKVMGHFGSMGWTHDKDRTFMLNGVVSRQAATIEVKLEGSASVPARIIDTGDPRAQFFIATWPAGRWQLLVARDTEGNELERYPAPDHS
jgi:hypothetical protein